MKANIAGLELHYLVKELQFLVNGKVDNIYNPKKEELILQLHVSGKGKQILRIISGKLLYLASSKEGGAEPSGFCMFLRKHLGGARLRSVRQLESERIVEFIFEKKDGKEKLIVELFGKGNIILCSGDDVVLSALVYHKWKDREIRAKLKYSYPHREYNFLDLKLNELKGLFSKTDKSLVKCLATELGLGGSYSEEVCLLAGVDKASNPSDSDGDSIKKILNSIKKISNNKTNPLIIYENGNIKDIVPFLLKKYEKLNKKEFKEYNEAFDYCFVEEVKEEKPKSKKEKEIDRLKRLIESQEKTIKDLGDKELKERRKGDLIYENYELVDNIIKELKKAKEKYSWDEIKKKLKGHKLIKEINSRDKVIDIEV